MNADEIKFDQMPVENNETLPILTAVNRSPWLLVLAVMTSLTASLCCIGPLLLITLGISGAWMSTLMGIEAWYPLLASVSIGLVVVAGWQLLQPQRCKFSRQVQATKLPALQQSASFVLALVLTLVLLSSEYWLVWLVG